jgi:hypothetical protein
MMPRRCPECLLVLAAAAVTAIMLGGAVLLGHVAVWMGP